MKARLTSILAIALLLTSAYGQDKTPRDEATESAAPAIEGQVTNPVPGILVPNNVQQSGDYVFESPAYAPYSHGCCAKCRHGISHIAHWLFYRPLPIPNHCRHCKHYNAGCTPDPMDFFVQRYGYYNWKANCPH